MVIQIDTREQKNNHITDYFDLTGIKYIRSKMYVGDYQRVDSGSVCIDKKFGLDEMYSCVVSGYDRFADECKRAKAAGISLIVLIEDDDITCLSQVRTWENPRRAKWERFEEAKAKGKRVPAHSSIPPVSSERIEKRMRTLSKRYGVRWEFCKKADTAKRILELLKYES